MTIPQILYETILWVEGFTAITAIIYFNREKHHYWKYFCLYLVLIFLCEVFGKYSPRFIEYDSSKFYNYFVIPLEFIFFYWLYAAKSFGKPKLFYILSLTYLLSFIPNELFFNTRKEIFSLNYTLGCLILMGLVIMEYYKQVNSSEILNFSRNRMFYINLGVTLFYIGTMPFWTFFIQIKQYKEIRDIYYSYFQMSLIVMYILFSVSLIWGKHKDKYPESFLRSS
ncbi:MAG: hypothetical protein MUW56_13390 [Chryseobacterium sp.]|uniref:hypothetical protein n=1 Tax=Chryseobacterium sp. TaxID=1871047 RepID=UPI0025BC81CE|nr:hypothetical protein [Chryseobacterium sp.]MCJ7934588.1 hypothetical protein [Chryseobacterium sp.]